MKVCYCLLLAVLLLNELQLSRGQDEGGGDINLEEAQLTDEQRQEGYAAAQESDCPPFWIDFCFNEAYRYCYFDQDRDTELCGSCLPGSFDWKTLCVSATAFDLLTYLEEFSPVYLRDIPEDERLNLLRIAIAFIAETNARNLPFELSLTPFSADSPEDALQRLGFLSDEAFNQSEESFRSNEPRYLQEASASPAAVDHRDTGLVTSVKDQGRCGCCWAVSLAGAIEGAAARNNGYLQSLSWQQFISCDDQNFGCNGGSLVYAMQYAVLTPFGGIASSGGYPYTDSKGSTTESCQVDGKAPAVQVTDAEYVVDFYDDLTFEERVRRLKAAVEQTPVAIVIRSNCQTISNYRSGILTEDEACACNDPLCADHAVLLVGYDDTTSPPCWIVKNSWGTGWGEKGYFRIAQTEKGPFGLFGILVHGVVPTAAQNITAQVYEDPSSGHSTFSGFTWTWMTLSVAATTAASITLCL